MLIIYVHFGMLDTSKSLVLKIAKGFELHITNYNLALNSIGTQKYRYANIEPAKIQLVHVIDTINIKVLKALGVYWILFS